MINSATSVTIDWSATGVPISTKGATPKLYFKSTTDATQLWAKVSSNVLMKNALKVNSSTQNLSCSWNGMCAYEVNSAGLAKTLEGAANSIEICGNVCALDSKASTAAKAVCRVPALATTYSAKTFAITETGVLTGKWFASNTKEMPKAYDDSVMDDYVDTAKECHVGINMKSG